MDLIGCLIFLFENFFSVDFICGISLLKCNICLIFLVGINLMFIFLISLSYVINMCFRS